MSADQLAQVLGWVRTVDVGVQCDIPAVSARRPLDAGLAAGDRQFGPYADGRIGALRMPYLHYGPELRFELDLDSMRQVGDAIGAHASRGGWVSFTDVHGREWTILVTAGIAIWIEPHDT